MVQFGEAKSSELSQLSELLGILFEQEAEFTPDRAKQERALAAILQDPKLGRIYVAREGQRVVAMASLLYTISTAEGGKAAMFEDLVVHPEYRRRGIGASLLGFVIEKAKEQAVLRITLLTDMQNEPAQALYRKLGFTGSPMRPMRLKLREKQ
jgi:ribosomal protein S18 acetylase RimI-like enzyme